MGVPQAMRATDALTCHNARCAAQRHLYLMKLGERETGDGRSSHHFEQELFFLVIAWLAAVPAGRARRRGGDRAYRRRYARRTIAALPVRPGASPDARRCECMGYAGDRGLSERTLSRGRDVPGRSHRPRTLP